MTLRWRWGKKLRLTGFALLALIAGLAVFVQIQQRILRWRAERLLADMRELQSHKGTWADAQKIMTRWGTWGAYEGSCTAERCDYRIIIIDTLSTLIWTNVDRYPILRTLSLPCTLMGEKDAFVVATLDIKNGIVEKSSYRLGLGELFARANAVNEFDPYIAGDQRMLHPEYWVGKNGGCTVCIKFETG